MGRGKLVEDDAVGGFPSKHFGERVMRVGSTCHERGEFSRLLGSLKNSASVETYQQP